MSDSRWDERNRYSYSGSDVAAFAYYPHSYQEAASLRLEIATLEQQVVGLQAQVAEQSELRAEILSSNEYQYEAVVEDGFQDSLNEHTRLMEDIERHNLAILDLKEELNGTLPIHLESLATISLSIHEPKGMVRALGHKGIKGFSRSVRTIAGTMVLLVVEDHPLAKLARARSGITERSGHSLDLKSGRGSYRNMSTEQADLGVMLSSLNRHFNVHLRYRSEVMRPNALNSFVASGEELRADSGVPEATFDNETNRTLAAARTDVRGARGALRQQKKAVRQAKRDAYSGISDVRFNVPKIATMLIEGIDIISEGITTSVNDMVTEVVIQFVAKDVKMLSVNHESDVMSYTKEELAELPGNIYQELQGAAMASEEHEAHIQEGMNRSTEIANELKTRKQTRRQARAEANRATWERLSNMDIGNDPGYDDIL